MCGSNIIGKINTLTCVALLLLTVAANSKGTKEWPSAKCLVPELPHYPFVRVKQSSDVSSFSPVLRFAHNPVISTSACSAYCGLLINKGHLCTSGIGGKSTCSGDDGGPLITVDIVPTQIGLISCGITLGCETQWPSIFARLTPFRSWIESTTGIPIRE